MLTVNERPIIEISGVQTVNAQSSTNLRPAALNKKCVTVTYTLSAEHLADLFTKALHENHFDRIHAGINVMSTKNAC